MLDAFQAAYRHQLDLFKFSGRVAIDWIHTAEVAPQPDGTCIIKLPHRHPDIDRKFIERAFQERLQDSRNGRGRAWPGCLSCTLLHKTVDDGPTILSWNTRSLGASDALLCRKKMWEMDDLLRRCHILCISFASKNLRHLHRLSQSSFTGTELHITLSMTQMSTSLEEL